MELGLFETALFAKEIEKMYSPLIHEVAFLKASTILLAKTIKRLLFTLYSMPNSNTTNAGSQQHSYSSHIEPIK